MKQTSFKLATRLAQSMGASFVKRDDLIYLVNPSNKICLDSCWMREEDVLRGDNERAGLLALGSTWMADGMESLPCNIGPHTTDEELDMILNVMGH